MRLPPLITPPLFIAFCLRESHLPWGYKGRSPLKNLFKKRESPSHACEGTYISYVWAREGVGGGFIITSPPAGETRGWASPTAGQGRGEAQRLPAQNPGRPKSRRRSAEGFSWPAVPTAPERPLRRDFLPSAGTRPGGRSPEGVSCPVLARTVFRSSSQRF